LYKNRILVVTGGTGSFGNQVVREFLNTNIKEIRIYSRDEKKQEDMRLQFKDKRLKFYIGDVRDKNSLAGCFSGADYLFHAAALKQVPSCEFFPLESVKTNIMGSVNVMEACFEFKLKKGIFLSTDKAVYPVNAMGMTKALMEKAMFSLARENIKNKNTIICATRYGNVMGSRGSVIPLFISQIKNKKDITITDPKMTRFLMTLPESVKLVNFAFQKGQQGDLFVQKAKSVRILDLAEALIDIFDSKSEIKIIGTRHGEKSYEALLSREELLRSQEIGNFFRVPLDDRSLNYDKYFFDGEKNLIDIHDYTSENVDFMKKAELKSLLLKVIKMDHISHV
jgi:UDP-N-acetylglucosamine 4,6-dehydratase